MMMPGACFQDGWYGQLARPGRQLADRNSGAPNRAKPEVYAAKLIFNTRPNNFREPARSFIRIHSNISIYEQHVVY